MLYRIVALLACPMMFLFYRLKFRGAHHVPSSGGAIIAANHSSYLDPVVIGLAAAHRRLSFMAKEELFRIPLFRRLIKWGNAKPIKRGGANRHALEHFEDMVRNSGNVLVLFPEGTRSPDGSLGSGRRGIGHLCLSARVPVIPALITGSYEAWPKHRTLPRILGRIEVRFGPPVEYNVEELNKSGDPSGTFGAVLMNRIAGLKQYSDPAKGFWSTVASIIRAT